MESFRKMVLIMFLLATVLTVGCTAGQQPPVPEQAGDPPAKQAPVKQEKPLVIISENLVFTDSGQLLQALDKEMETLLVLLEKMDDIQDDDFNF